MGAVTSVLVVGVIVGLIIRSSKKSDKKDV